MILFYIKLTLKKCPYTIVKVHSFLLGKIFTFKFLNFKNQKLELILFKSLRCSNTHDTGIRIIVWLCFTLILAILEIQLWTFIYMHNKNYIFFQPTLATHVYDMKLLIIIFFSSVSSIPNISLIKELCNFFPVDFVYTLISSLRIYQTGICKIAHLEY